MSDGHWLDDATDGPEAELREALNEARARLPDQVALRRLWGRVAYPDLDRATRARWSWFVGGVITSSALALALAFCLWPAGSRSVAGRAHEAVGPTVPARPVAEARPAVAAVPAGPAVAAKDPPPAQPLQPQSRPLEWLPRSRSVAAPAVIRTGAAETVQVSLRGGAEARLERSSIMNVEAQTNGNDRPTIERGEVAFSVPHQLPGQSFSVIAGPYRIVVVGTKFRLRVEGAHVAVAVDEGVVEIWRRNRLARLVPGDSWSSPQETPARAAADSSASAARESSRTRPPVAASEAAPPRTEPPAPRAPVTDPTPEARAALAGGEPHRALETYRAVAARGGPAAENAEYEIGRILRDRLGQPEDAIAAWRRYRALHPDGLLRVETDVSIIETLVSAGDSTVALAEANDFLHRHPDSERRGEIARVAGDLYRARGDCAHAVVAYQTALSAQRSRETAEYAAFHRAACLVRLGDSSANDALQAYLRSWPSGRFRSNASRLLRGVTDHASAP